MSKSRILERGPPKLGDMVEKALSSVGITSERVSKWIGEPCSCKERKEKLNKLSAWVYRVMRGQTEDAEKHLDDIINTDKKDKDST